MLLVLTNMGFPPMSPTSKLGGCTHALLMKERSVGLLVDSPSVSLHCDEMPMP